ncbi:AbrB family transcriptional regulator [Pseudaminobacter arsenicus]|uniref:AbrB family transcriptional regulator n=1 Tax=Borborobacter arsenicus TaxID=1851146 RepID=A0A432V4E0_9HYPH|nr:AbrB family transcriptional regulator [Pseudaminobacter arsenicus]RUM96998.1 AbrB family transcriptional regulator [Pseudaminobacter arsenicus]
MREPATHGSGERGFFGGSPARIFLALVVGLAGAGAAKLAGAPLPYLLGPLAACAVAAVCGAPVASVPYGRELGQVAVGLAIGLRFVPAVMVATLKLMPMMVLATLATIVATTTAAIMMHKLARIDRRTAFFATAAAGLAEMAVVAHQKGGDSDIVAVVHLVRVIAIVTTVPFLVTIFGAEGAVYTVPVRFEGEALVLAALFAVSGAAAYLVRRLRFPNSWLLVPTALGALVAGFGFGPFAVPHAVLTVAQVVIGVWLGCRFRREMVRRLPRVTVAAFVTTAFLIAAASLFALALSAMTGLSFVTSLLAVAPAGITEMVLTATAMHLDAATVTAFQIMRIAVVMTTILFTFRAFETLSRRMDGKST